MRHWNRIPVLTLQDKRGPEIRRVPTLLLPHSLFRFAQRRRRCQTLVKHRPIEVFHQFRGGVIIDFPQAGDDATGTGVHKSSGQPDKAFALYFLAQSGATGTQHHQPGP